MGATDFFTVSKGKTAKEAFANAVDEARYMDGHGGYTGTIAEKHEFIMVSLPRDGMSREEIESFAYDQLDDHKRISDKWGPAGCIKLEDGKYLFFGWASS